MLINPNVQSKGSHFLKAGEDIVPLVSTGEELVLTGTAEDLAEGKTLMSENGVVTGVLKKSEWDLTNSTLTRKFTGQRDSGNHENLFTIPDDGKYIVFVYWYHNQGNGYFPIVLLIENYEIVFQLGNLAYQNLCPYIQDKIFRSAGTWTGYACYKVEEGVTT